MTIAPIAVFAADAIRAKLTGPAWVVFVVLCLATLFGLLGVFAVASDRWDQRAEQRRKYTAAGALMPLWLGGVSILAAAAVLGYLIVGVWIGSIWAYNDALPRLAVASNPITAAETLDRLADDPIEEVRRRLASNPSTPPETLDRLADDDSWRVRVRVGQHPGAATETLDRLARDGDENVRAAVCGLPDPPDTCDPLS